MAKSFSNVKSLSLFIYNNAMVRRGYAAAAASQAKIEGATKKTQEKTKGVREKPSWAPDPKTGYYRPEASANEVDAAELRASLLNDKH